ncbi:restriction endonuclease subunit S [Aeromonas caviae]|uniref:restriction endonuclease subunit S n=1 Tax=Aeromonas caviae TaxID=648 RepID=UPI003EC581FD
MAEQMMQEAAGKAIPAGYKQTEVGIIPEDWTVANLSAITEHSRPISYGIVQTGPLIVNGVPCIRVVDISDGKIKRDNLITTTKEISDSYRRTILKDGDLIIPLRGKVGEVGLVDGDLVGANLTRGVALIAPQKDYASEFIKQYLSNRSSADRLLSSMNGSALQEITIETLRRFSIALPIDVKEQTAIGNVLSDSDALIDALEQLIAKKQAIKTAAMQQLLTGRARLPQFAQRPDGTTKGYKTSELGQIPEDWKVLPLGELCHFENGDRSSNYPSSDEFVSFGIPFINAGHIDNGVIDSKGMDYISAVIYARLGGGKVKPGDLVYCLRGSLGKFGVVPDDFGMGAIASSLVIVRPITSRTSCEFISEYFKSDISKRMVSLWAGGAAQPNLGAKELANFLVPLPNNLEQTAIATILSDMDSELNALEQKLAKARDVKQGMMQQLLTGRIRLPVEQVE